MVCADLKQKDHIFEDSGGYGPDTGRLSIHVGVEDRGGDAPFF